MESFFYFAKKQQKMSHKIEKISLKFHSKNQPKIIEKALNISKRHRKKIIQKTVKNNPKIIKKSERARDTVRDIVQKSNIADATYKGGAASGRTQRQRGSSARKRAPASLCLCSFKNVRYVTCPNGILNGLLRPF